MSLPNPVPSVDVPELAPNVSGLIRDHLGLVRKVAWSLYAKVGRRGEFDDLQQAGYLGLVNAAQRYVEQPGVAFAAYAAIRVRGAILDHLRTGSNLCRATISMQQKIKSATHRVEQRLMRSADPAEVAMEMGMTVAEYLDWMTQMGANSVQSLDQVYSDHSLAFQDGRATGEDMLEQAAMRSLLRDSLARLPEREALVLHLYYVEELTVFAIADKMKVTTGRVSQIKKAAVERLRGLMQKREAA